MLKTCNGPLAAKVREIWDTFAEESYQISVHLFSNQATLQRDAHNRLVEALSRHEIALFEYGFIERVALASNTQSRILNRDLRANDNIQRQLVECLRPHNYFYVRKRGENAPRQE
ncbi:hypothetical protein FJ434_02190 [Mesorhizobium sp. B2-5-13]|nr:hypothetical protein FJ432_08925 [Mesorhizobium sp. B2-6-5]TPJ93531.1 hypothetical protein FJ434_02190 [Mesorhizobium sp. B2-5-13]TPK48553.1 hypothetical protein FJ560_15450 [Mesorhizobium sp. B2-5-5]